jgi:hypothetical protein
MDGNFHNNLMSRHFPEGTEEIHEKARPFAVFWNLTPRSIVDRCTYQLRPFSDTRVNHESKLKSLHNWRWPSQYVLVASFFHSFSFLFFFHCHNFRFVVQSEERTPVVCEVWLSVFTHYWEIYVVPLSIINIYICSASFSPDLYSRSNLTPLSFVTTVG